MGVLWRSWWLGGGGSGRCISVTPCTSRYASRDFFLYHFYSCVQKDCSRLLWESRESERKICSCYADVRIELGRRSDVDTCKS